jgi:tellurite resistance protein
LFRRCAGRKQAYQVACNSGSGNPSNKRRIGQAAEAQRTLQQANIQAAQAVLAATNANLLQNDRDVRRARLLLVGLELRMALAQLYERGGAPARDVLSAGALRSA